MRILARLITASLLFAAAPAFAAEDGAALYQKNCASCHGADGKADTPVGKAMKAPAIAGTAGDPAAIVAKLKASAKHKGVVGKLSDAELTAIAGALPK